MTWINKQLGSTIDQDKKNPLGLTINLDQQLTWIDSQLLQHINRPIAHLLHYCSMFKTSLQHIYGMIQAHLQHHCSTFTAPLQHIYSTIAAHLLTAILLNTKFRLSCKERCYLFEGLIENGKVKKEFCITWHELLQPMRYPTCDEMIKIDHVKYG